MSACARLRHASPNAYHLQESPCCVPEVWLTLLTLGLQVSCGVRLIRGREGFAAAERRAEGRASKTCRCRRI